MAEFAAPKITCPFYITGSAQYITCESALTGKGSAKHFSGRKKKRTALLRLIAVKITVKAAFIITA